MLIGLQNLSVIAESFWNALDPAIRQSSISAFKKESKSSYHKIEVRLPVTGQPKLQYMNGMDQDYVFFLIWSYLAGFVSG